MKDIIQPMVFDINELKKRAENGDKLSCYILARSYDSEENGAEQSFEKAVYWYKKGSELNDPRSMYGLGACYYFGDGVAKDLDKAYDLFVQAYPLLLKQIEEEQNEPKVQAFSKFCLGAYYYFGFGDIEKDMNKAFELIYECALEGHLAAIYDLGANFYYNGVGTDRDLSLSRDYLELASNVGLPRAKRKLIEYQCTYKEEIRKNK